jgi:hypothetical protein
MPGPIDNPPRAPAGTNASFGPADFSEFDSQGLIRFTFVIDGTQLKDYLVVRLRKSCRDANFFFIPWKDCRPLIDVSYERRFSYHVAGHTYDTWYTFNAQLTEPKNQPSDKQCRDVDLEITIDVRTVLPDPDGKFDSWIGKGSFNSRPLATWPIRMRFCCKDCSLGCIFDPPQDYAKASPSSGPQMG